MSHYPSLQYICKLSAKYLKALCINNNNNYYYYYNINNYDKKIII